MRVESHFSIKTFILSLFPGTAGFDKYYNLGLLLEKTGKRMEAIQQDIKAIYQGYAEAHNQIGFVYLQIGKYDLAKSHLMKALQINPDFAIAPNNMGSLLVYQHRKPDAKNFYRKAIQIDPDFGEAHNNLGIILFEENDIQESINHFRIELQQTPDSKDIRQNLNTALAIQNQLKRVDQTTRKDTDG